VAAAVNHGRFDRCRLVHRTWVRAGARARNGKNPPADRETVDREQVDVDVWSCTVPPMGQTTSAGAARPPVAWWRAWLALVLCGVVAALTGAGNRGGTGAGPGVLDSDAVAFLGSPASEPLWLAADAAEVLAAAGGDACAALDVLRDVPGPEAVVSASFGLGAPEAIAAVGRQVDGLLALVDTCSVGGDAARSAAELAEANVAVSRLLRAVPEGG
jgi:hypothetical protein